MRRIFRKMKIQSRIVMIYFGVLILSCTITIAALSVMNDKYSEQEIGNAGVQTIKALEANLNLMLDNVKQFSNLIYFDSTIQDTLGQIESSNIDPVVQQTIQRTLVNMILSGDYISTANIFDNYYNDYNSYKIGPIHVNGEKIPDTKWYHKMKEADGDSFFIHRSEGILDFPTREGKNYISLVREICNQDTYEHLAILLLTIDEETIQECFEEVSGPSETQFFIVDSSGEYIVSPGDTSVNWKQYIPDGFATESGYQTVHVDGNKMVCIYQTMDIEGWSLVGMMPVSGMGMQYANLSSAIGLIVGLNLCFLFLCSVVLSKLIFSPLTKMENHMKLVEKGQFEEMPVDEEYNEINTLKRVFNGMIHSIEQLIERIKEEEHTNTKNKLDIIQAQINPHFLYNTLDAVSALALIKDNENCFKMTQALGSFYRNSLNSGKDFVTVKDEISCIKSYITILNIRYDNQIVVHYEVEDEILKERILKLILQPVVENSVHHGFAEKGHQGLITIKAYRDEDEIIFIITDDGCGMSEERIAAVMNGETQQDKHGFGMYSLIQRVTLYYQIENPVTIHSEPGSGTEVTIRVKSTEGNYNNEEMD